MNSERPEEISGTASSTRPTSDDRQNGAAADRGQSADAARHETTVVVRGETVSSPVPTASSSHDSPSKDKEKPVRREISEAKTKLQSRLPVLDDDADLGAQKEYIVIRDGKADLAFTGTLLASAAPSSAPKGQWQAYRIYETNGGKHVFSKTTHSVYVDEHDTHEAEIFDPSPASVPSQLLRSARDLARSHPLTWRDAAVEFFGYNPLAKALYRKLDARFEEHID